MHVEHLFVQRAVRGKPALHHLHPIKIGGQRVHRCLDHQARRTAIGTGERTAHGHAHAVAKIGKVTTLGILCGKAIARKDPHPHARAGGAVDFLAAEGGEDRLAVIAVCPDTGEAARAHLHIGEDGACGIRPHALCREEVLRHLAEEVVLFHRREAGVGIARRDHAELERVAADPRCFGQAAQICSPHI